MSRHVEELAEVVTARETVHRLFAAALHAVDPTQAVRRVLRWRDGTLQVGQRRIDVRGEVFLVAIGKAAVAMAQGALAELDAATVTGLVITKEGHDNFSLPPAVAVYEAGHPIPDERGERATRDLLERLKTLDDDDLVLALISGGGSALLELPRPGVTLGELARVTDLLLRGGAPIDALNAVRAPLSQVKSGGLRAAAPKSTWVTLILSDVLGNDPRVIASGPTVPSRADPAMALSMIDKYRLRPDLPQTVLDALESEDRDLVAVEAEHDVLVIVGDNAAAVAAAAAEAGSGDLMADVVWTAAEGEASELGRLFVDELERASEATDVLLGGGEATVTVRGEGSGGRNTEFALAAALEMDRRGRRDWVVASLATDGQDALTGLAGAIVDGWSCERARQRGIDPSAALADNDSAMVFAMVGGAVQTGPTGTNVNDLYIAVRVKNAGADCAEGGD